jgi:hypothetical protein
MSVEGKNVIPDGYDIEPLIEGHIAPEGHEHDCAGEDHEADKVFEDGDI